MTYDDIMSKFSVAEMQEMIKRQMVESDGLRSATFNRDADSVGRQLSRCFLILDGCLEGCTGADLRIAADIAYSFSMAKFDYCTAFADEGHGSYSDLIIYPQAGKGDRAIILGFFGGDGASADDALEHARRNHNSGLYRKYLDGFSGEIIYVGVACEMGENELTCTIG